jgi:hypothetical protein
MTSTQQFDLDFSGKLPPSAQEGRQTSYENSKEEWRVIFEACILAAARKKFEIVSDDVLSEVESLGHAPTTHNLAAIGGAMHRACKMGILNRTDRVKRSGRPEKHGNRQNIWESNYYRPEKSA